METCWYYLSLPSLLHGCVMALWRLGGGVGGCSGVFVMYLELTGYLVFRFSFCFWPSSLSHTDNMLSLALTNFLCSFFLLYIFTRLSLFGFSRNTGHSGFDATIFHNNLLDAGS